MAEMTPDDDFLTHLAKVWPEAEKHGRYVREGLEYRDCQVMRETAERADHWKKKYERVKAELLKQETEKV